MAELTFHIYIGLDGEVPHQIASVTDEVDSLDDARLALIGALRQTSFRI